MKENRESNQPPLPPQNAGEESSRKRPLWRCCLRWLFYILCAHVTLFFLLSLLFYLPPVQNWLVRQAAQVLSEEMGKEVSVGRLRVTFLLDVDVQRLLVCETANQSGDTLLFAESCVLDLDCSSLLSGRVGVDAFDLRQTKVDTQDWVDELVVRGQLQRFYLDVHDVDLNNRNVNLTKARIDGCDVDISLRDTTILDEDTTQMLLPWQIQFADVCLTNSRVGFHTARDTMSVHADLQKATLDKAFLNLESQQLKAENLVVQASRIVYDMNYEPRRDGFDPNHILLTDFNTALKNLEYNFGTNKLRFRLAEMQVRERCGFELEQLRADIELDTAKLIVNDAELRTPDSRIAADVALDWSSLTPRRRGRMEAALTADISWRDAERLLGNEVSAVQRAVRSDQMLTATVELTGNVDTLSLRSFSVKMPEMLEVQASGAVGSLFEPERLAADLSLEARTFNLSPLQQLLGLTAFRIPAGHLLADARVKEGDYKVRADMRQAGGALVLDGHFNTRNEAYDARLNTQQLTLSNFLPLDSVLCVTARGEISGRGTNLFSPRTRARLLAMVTEMNYGARDVSRVRLDGVLEDGHTFLSFRSDNEVLEADGCVEARIGSGDLEEASFDIDLHGIDFHSLGITKKPLTASMSLHANGYTDLKEKHQLQGSVSAMKLQTADTTYYPKDIDLDLFMRPDSMFANLRAGDLALHLNSPQGLQQVLARLNAYGGEMTRQVKEKDYNQSQLKAMLPDVELCLKSGRQNPAANISAMLGYAFQEMDIDLHCDTLSGLNGYGWMHALQTEALRLDTLQFNVSQGEKGMELLARVCNNRRNPDITFDARLKANLSPHNATFALQYFDDKGRKGIDLGTDVVFHNRCIRARVNPLNPTLAYRQFAVNDSNFISLDSLGHIDADLVLLADDGTGLKLYASPNEQAEQDLTVSLNRVNLGQIFSVLPYMPLVGGLLQGDVHLLKMEDVLSVGTDLQVNSLTYEGKEMGNVGLNAAYMPNSDGSHYLDGFLTQNDSEVITFNGLYREGERSDSIDAEVQLAHFPLEMANAFLGDMVQLAGRLSGGIAVEGALARPAVNGQVLTESMHVLSPLYSIDLRVPDESIVVADSRLDLSRLKAYSTGTQPLQLGGYVDFSSLSNIFLDIALNARDFELINAPKSRKAEAYGKLVVDMSMLLHGTASNLSMTGDLAVLGKSDLTYVLKDSPISVEDEMADLVTFVDFGDTLKTEKVEVEIPSNFNMRLGVSINQATQVRCLLSEDGTNYANIEGGGDLTLTYDKRHGVQLFGRYTILSGKMNYSLMIVSLKDCQIERDSYVDFNGDILNPRLSISAYERLNTTVTEEQTPRSVAFDVGLNITQTLGDMGLEFTLDAPEDLNIQNEIAQMTAEQRGRVAVTLMATGMYVVEGKQSGGFNTTNALNSFLNSQISQITGKALNSIDLSLGVQNTNTASGNITTDYSFRFAKRFWGNRISLIIGGKVSSGAEAENTGDNIIDNVSIEYRLDKSATRHITLYYDKNYESILEGQVTEMGAGLVLRRKSDRLGDLFRFRNRKEKKGL